MKIKWLQDCQLEVVVSFDEKTETTETQDIFPKAGEIDDVDPLAYNNNPDDGVETAGFQYPDGSCVYGVPCELFEIVEGKEELEAVK